MKFKLVIVGGTLCAALVVVNGCNKQEAAPAPVTPTASEATTSEAAKVVDAAKSTPAQVADQATTQAQAGEQQAQGLIERAKGYVADQKYQDALGSLNQLATTKLTPDQQKLVDDLKAKIQAALATAAGTGTNAASGLGGALGGALGGKK